MKSDVPKIDTKNNFIQLSQKFRSERVNINLVPDMFFLEIYM